MLSSSTDTFCRRFPGRFAGEPVGAPRGRRCGRGALPRSGVEVRRAQRRASLLLIWARTVVAVLFCLLPLFPSSSLAASQGDKIVNSASLSSYNALLSNSSVTVTVVVRTPSTIEFLKFAPLSADAEPVALGAYRTGSDPATSFSEMPAPVWPGSSTPIDLSQPLPLVAATLFHGGEPIFLRVTDLDQNLDRTLAETLLVTITDPATGDVEVLRLTETGLETGVFTGYIQSTKTPPPTPYSGNFSVTAASDILATYTDLIDGTDTATTAALVDPFGIVFDSRTGLPVDGAKITLLDTDTGLPATVYGDDGVSSYPAILVSGGSATDSSGLVYQFTPGHYRFPMVMPGHYRLQIEPPAGYAYPSTVITADLQNLPNGPFAIAQPGSRGEPFVINPGPVIRIDLPVDPATTGLWLQKNAGKDLVGVGDFVPYRLQVENSSAGAAADVKISDRLPAGFRYRAGSTRLAGEKGVDPSIAADGRTLTFTVGNLPGGEKREVRYVAEVAAGVRTGKAINTATATAALGLVSNQASATVTVRDEFFRQSTFLVGRVVIGACGEAGNEGLAGARIYLEDGTYVITDDKGRYHFEGLRPGDHVVQLDLDSLPDQYEALPCEENSRFAGRAYSQFVDLQGGSLWRADFHVGPTSKAKGEVRIELKGEVGVKAKSEVAIEPTGEVAIELKSALAKDEATYRVLLHGVTVPLRNLRLTVSLPPGVDYLPGSSLRQDEPMADPEIAGSRLTYRLGEVPGDWASQVQFRVKIRPEVGNAELVAAATLTCDTPKTKDLNTPPAQNLIRHVVEESRQQLPEIILHPHFPSFGTELAAADRAELDGLAATLKELHILGIEVTGHTDNVRIAPHHRAIHADNFALSEARARSVARYLGDALQLPPAQISLAGLADLAPVATNSTAAGRALNRRVEVRARAEKIVLLPRLEPGVNEGAPGMVKTTGLPSSEALPLEAVAKASTPSIVVTPGQALAETLPKQDSATGVAQISEAERTGFLSPIDGSRLTNRVNAIRLRLDSRLKPLLTVDGKVVPADRIGFTMADTKTGKTLYSYIGVDFGDQGEHLLHLQGLDPFGNARSDLKIKVVRTGEIALIRLLPTKENPNVADGKTPIRVRLQILDVNGEVIKAPVGLKVLDGNLQPLKEKSELPEGDAPADLQVGSAASLRTGSAANQVQVDAEGDAWFQPTQASGPYRATLAYNDKTVKVETYVKPLLRDWILVGLADGTAGYNSVSEHMETTETGLDQDFYENGRVAFFAKGRIQGKWLLTMAYDTDKPNRRDQSLFQQINPNTYYTLYGDATKQAYEAASARKLYLKIERDQFYVLFGDFNTGLTVTELSRYSRSLNGLKTEMQTSRFAVNAFISDTNQAFVKDELRGDGTSGLYYLSRRDIVVNSDKIAIEVRDRFHGEIVLSSRPLSRFLDYDIDYDTGALLFKQPVLSKDENFNPVYIVADYESNGAGQDLAYTYGGRAAVKTLDGRLEVGATAVHEGQKGGNGDLQGVDTTWKITDRTEAHAEAATSKTSAAVAEQSGSAWLAEITHRANRLTGNLYFREQEAGFGLGQQQGSESGTRKFGLTGDWKLDDKWGLTGQAYRQYNLGTGGVRDVEEATFNYTEKLYTLLFGLREASDRLGNGQTNQSSQVTLGGSWKPLGDRLTLRSTYDQSLVDNANADFPTRLILGADYRLTSAVSLTADQEFTWGEKEDSRGTRVGLKSTPWQGGEIGTSLGQNSNENGERIFANLGLKQTWQLDQRLSLDGSLDRSQTIKHPGNTPFNTNTPAASGFTEDFTAVSLGANYKKEKWAWANRLEYRTADSADKWGLFSGIVGEVRSGLGLAARLQMFRTEPAANAAKTNGELSLGLAHRPLATHWIIFDRLDYIFEDNGGGAAGDFSSWRLVNNLHGNYKADHRTQISLQYGAKYIQEHIDDEDYSGYTDLTGIEGRYDLNKRWDLGLRAGLLHSWSSETLDYSAGASVGYKVVENTWISLGYNFAGFTDRDFSATDFTAQGVYVKCRAKFDQNTARELLAWWDK